MGLGQEDTGVTKAAKGVTGVLGNTVTEPPAKSTYNSLTPMHQVGGLTNTVGGVVGAAGRGLGETVSGATGGNLDSWPLDRLLSLMATKV